MLKQTPLVPKLQDRFWQGIFGRDFSTSNLDAATRYWGHIAYVFGMSEDLIPLGFKEGVEEDDYLLSMHGYASIWSPKVADALLRLLDEAIVTLVNNALIQGLLKMTLMPFSMVCSIISVAISLDTECFLSDTPPESV